jgi:flagellar biosynthesis chaperone FliJ
MTKPISTLTTEYQEISSKKKSLETELYKLKTYMNEVDTKDSLVFNKSLNTILS